jgi:hypothetical protein
MKVLVNLLVQMLLVCALLLSISCSTKTEDSKEVAEESNEGKFEQKRGSRMRSLWLTPYRIHMQ